MKIAYVKMIGFRNFGAAIVNFAEKTLIIGANDVGKSNLLHALRILLDRSLSESDLEPRETDFHIGLDSKQADVLEISVKLTDITEDAVVARLKGYINDDSETYLSYRADRATLTYSVFAGHDPTAYEELDSRTYLKHIHFKYVESCRDIHQYIQREKRYLLKLAKTNRSTEEETADSKREAGLQASLAKVNDEINELTYVKDATSNINEELKEISLHHGDYSVSLEAQSLNFSNFVERLSLSATSSGKRVGLGGDGRNNQILVGLWKAKSEIEHDTDEEAVIYCIEEPEAHLHPHQQRKLADYLVKKLKGQVFVSTHSPQIASEFRPDGIVRLFEKKGKTVAANKGCSDFMDETWEDFGYRMSILPAEAFFADAVLLVEGPSEIQFYHALAEQIGIDLDYHNISILSVDGIDFEVYVAILKALEIPWTLRTDNDVFKVQNSKPPKWRFAGLNRALKIAEEQTYKHNETIDTPQKLYSTWVDECKVLDPKGIFVACVDLENDLAEVLKDELLAFSARKTKEDAIAFLQERKAIRMAGFLAQYADALANLSDDRLAMPLHHAVKLSEERRKLATSK